VGGRLLPVGSLLLLLLIDLLALTIFLMPITDYAKEAIFDIPGDKGLFTYRHFFAQ